MAAVDKKLAKKLAKMSEEERTAFLEKMRLQEEEAQRQKEEFLLNFLNVSVVHETVPFSLHTYIPILVFIMQIICKFDGLNLLHLSG